MTRQEAICIIQQYMSACACVSYKAEEGIIRLLQWLEAGGILDEDDRK